MLLTVDAGVSTMWDGASHREALSSPVADTLRPPLAESVAAGIAALQPGARIVAILREPADRWVIRRPQPLCPVSRRWNVSGV